MAVSDVDESPRGLDFVFDINRLNVAVSRAKALAIIVANSGFEKCNPSNLKQISRASFFYKDYREIIVYRSFEMASIWAFSYGSAPQNEWEAM